MHKLNQTIPTSNLPVNAPGLMVTVVVSPDAEGDRGTNL